MKKIIIFGGAGFIGSHYQKFIKENIKDCKLESYDLQSINYSNFIDVRNQIETNSEYNNSDLIINLAAIHQTPGHPDHDYFETNIKGAENVCEFAERKGINNIIFTSSIAPYGAGEEVKNETTLPTPNTPYGISKLIAEYIHKNWQSSDKKNRKLLIIRPGVVYGKNENGNNTRLYKALKLKRFFYPGRKNTIKANIYVKDLVQLSLKIFDAYNTGYKLYNFTYEPRYTIEQIVNEMCELGSITKPMLVINGNLLKLAAYLINFISLGQIGIHPKRIDKLMKSTNISGKKILDDGFGFNYNLKSSMEDWYKDCNSEGLF